MNSKVLGFIRKEQMLSPGDHVICALSGGKDSMALLHVLWSLKDELGVTVSAAHMNHNLRGEESLRDEEFVKAQCSALGVPLALKSEDVSVYAKANKLGLEEAARNLRYEFLESISPGAKIATAHTAEDNLETMLLHLIRGCGLHGLSAISPIRGNVIRPLLMTDRREIEAYLEANNIPHVEDSTNAQDVCLRNRIRHHVLPLLISENPNLPTASSSLCMELGREDQYLDELATAERNKLQKDGKLSVPGLLSLPENMIFRVLGHYLSAVPQLQRKHLKDALSLCESPSPSASLSLPGDFRLRREYDLLVLDTAQISFQPDPKTIGPGQVVSFGPWKISCQAAPCPKDLPQDTISLILPPTGVFTLRCRQTGDRISLPGGTKKLSRYLMDQKIPANARDTLPVVLCGDQLAAVLPIAADKNFRAKHGEDSLILTATRMEEVK